MTEIKLLPHNQDMVERIEKAMVEGNHKIFYTEATGLGKSFIFMYLVHKYFKNKKVLYICPKMHIWYNMTGYKEFELIKDCITFVCNADFNKIKHRHMGFDAIFIDEAHHLTAPIQGENILTLANITVEDNPNAYVFGFTATPYVNGKLIGDKYFDTSVIGMDLISAIDKGILQKIKYAVAINDDIVLTKKEQNLLVKYNIDTTHYMVTDLFNQYPNVKHWLAYFPYIDELYENIPYFEKYFPDYKIFIIHSKQKNSEKYLREYERYEGKAILASVSMVLEGIHPKTVEGILLYRNVYSQNTFIQILGRLGIMSPYMNPICVDIYSSYDNFINNNITVFNRDCAITGFKREKVHNYFYMTAETYKFIEICDLIYGLRNKFHIHEYRGITWTSDRGLSKKLGKSTDYVHERKHSGKSYEEIIDYCLDNPPEEPRSYRGITWTSDIDLSKKLGKSTSYVTQRKQHFGNSYEEIIDYCLDNPPEEPKSYRGITWINDKDLSKKLGRNANYVHQRKHSGKSYEEIIDYCLDNTSKESKSYRGITWTSNIDLSKKLGRTDNYVNQRKQFGKSYEEIIDYCLDNPPEEPKSYRGITWTSDIGLSKKLGKSNNYVYQQKRSGNSYEEIIDCYLDNPPEEPKSYRGITWTSDIDLSKKLGKSASYLTQHKRSGKSYEEIIDYCLDNSLEEPMSYRGITWTSDIDLSKKLGKTPNYIHQRKHSGKSYEEIIDYCLDNTSKESKSYRGITWTSDIDLSKKLGKSANYVNQRKQFGKSYEEIIDYCLDNPPEEPKSYRGITWTSDIDLSKKLGRTDNYVHQRKQRFGKSYEEIIDYCLDKSIKLK